MAYNIGSIAVEVRKLVENIPSTFSGTAINSVIDRQIFYIQQFTGLTIGSPTIQDTYVPALTYFTASEILGAMEMLGVDVATVRLGDFSESKGSQSNTTAARNYFNSLGEKALTAVNNTTRYYKVF